MATATLNVNEVLTKWRRDVNYTFVRKSRFGPYTGASANSIIRIYKDLQSSGRSINVPLVDQLRSEGVSTGQLTGREEGIDNYGMPLYADWARDAVAITKNTEKEAAFEIDNTIRPLLTNWLMRKQRDEYIDALLSIPTAAVQPGRLSDPGNVVNGLRWGGNGGANGSPFGSTNIATATAAQKNLWATANDDRIVYGALNSNKVTGNVASSMANVSAATGRMTAAVGSLLKYNAQQTTAMASWPAITPYQRVGDDQEWFVCFMGSRAFRDLKADPVMYQANRDAREREGSDPTKSNPLFTGGGLVYDGVIYREIPEMDQRLLQVGVGSGSVDIAPVILCGQSAMGLVLGQEAKPTRRDETDYGFLKGVGIEAQYGIGKIAKAPTSSAGTVGDLKDWGIVTGFVAAPPNP